MNKIFRIKEIKILSFILALIFCLPLTMKSFAQVDENSSDEQMNIQQTEVSLNDQKTYYQYYNAYISKQKPEATVEIDITTLSSANGDSVVKRELDGKTAVEVNKDAGWFEWEFNVPEEGLFSVYLDYYAVSGPHKDILVSIMFDGVYPFKEAEAILIPRIWEDKRYDNGKSIQVDKVGNDIRPPQVEKQGWTRTALSDVTGLYNEPYLFYLTPGEHSIRLNAIQDSFALNNITIKNQKAPVSYEEYIAKYSEADKVKGVDTIRQEAELAYEKNSPLLYPVYDRGSSATLPSDPYYIKMNTIGQSNWKNQGEQISWKVSVPKSGLYRVAFRARQNLNPGMNSYRTLLINGEIPFKECKEISFKYETNWEIVTIGSGEQFVYLKNGDILTLECSSGTMSAALRDIQNAILRLNMLYRKIIIIVGPSPDVYRDYSLDKQIPDIVNELENVGNQLGNTSKLIKGTIKLKGSQASNIDKVVKLLRELSQKPVTISQRLGSLKENIESLGSLITSLGQQPLELDCIYYIPSDRNNPKAQAPILGAVRYGVTKFIVSFIYDYNALGSDDTSHKSINLWISTGRDQAQILNNMIMDSFTEKYGVGVNLSMVDTGDTLIQATLAGKGPDVAFMIPKVNPVNLAMRGMLVDLGDYDLGTLMDEIDTSSFAPFYYKNSLYAVPESQIFDVIFYRTDIFEELNIQPPDTWEDFYNVLRIIQKNNLQVGIPEVQEDNAGVSAGISTFDKLLFQRGGTYYDETMSKTMFETEDAFNAFEEWVKLYSVYGLDRSFNFYNRFRSGEMPIGIAGYNTFNQIYDAAPEIRGLWKMAPIPGIKKSDGKIDRSQPSYVTGSIVTKAAKQHGVDSEAVELVKWWASHEAQSRYATEIEATLGIASRYAPANRLAFSKIGWSDEDKAVLENSSRWLENVPQIPGNYYVERSLTNALRDAIDKVNLPRRSLALHNRSINEEIDRKRKEFED